MKQIILDTCIFIDHFRDYKPATSLLERLSSEDSSLFVSVLTVTEILSGQDCNDASVRLDVEEALLPIEKVYVDSDIARKAAEFRRLYGTPLVDAIIAATAFKLKAILYSRNAKHYSKIKEIRVEKPY